jgi:hypothetical protein
VSNDGYNYDLTEVTHIELDLKYATTATIKMFIGKTLVEIHQVNRLEAYELFSKINAFWMKAKGEKLASKTIPE